MSVPGRAGSRPAPARARRRRLAAAGTRSEITGPCRVSRTSSATGGAAANRDRLVAARERLRAVRRQVAAGIGGIEPLDEQVLGVRAGVGEAPGELAVAAEHDERQAGQRGADHARGPAPRDGRGTTCPGACSRDAGRWPAAAAPLAVRLPATTQTFEPIARRRRLGQQAAASAIERQAGVSAAMRDRRVGAAGPGQRSASCSGRQPLGEAGAQQLLAPVA